MRKSLWITLVLLVFVAPIAYLKFAESHWRNNFVWALMTHYPWERVRGYTQFYFYWQGYMRELRFDDENKVYSFASPIQQAKFLGDHWNAGLLQYHEGHLDQAIIELNKHNRDDDEGLFWRAMAYLRRGVNARCLTNGSELSDPSSVLPQCAIPIELGVDDSNPDLTKAAELFEVLSERNSRDKYRRLWLLNLSRLFNGQNPVLMNFEAGVRNDLANDLDLHEQDAGSGIQLINRARELGVDNFDAGKGVAVEDFDRDGDLDIVTGGFYAPTRFYSNHRGRHFIDRSVEMGVDGFKGAHIITAADYDNDGWIDLFISHPTGTHIYGGFSLLRNEQGNRFVDVTYESGLLNPRKMLRHGAFTWTSAWADIDNDGDLDLFVANWGGKQLINGKPALDSSLYLNEQGRFFDVSEDYGLRPYLEKNLIVGAAFGDYDGDGFPDLALTSMMPGFPVLFKNIEGKSFQADESVRAYGDGGFTVAFTDLNHDGRLDLFRGVALLPDSNIQSFITDHEIDHGYSRVWIQKENGKFALSENFFRNHRPMASMGANFGDLNNDGAYDFYLGSGGPQPWFLLPNVLYLGAMAGTQPSDRLKNITFDHGAGTLAKGHGIVFFDFDNDGDQDIYSSLGGMWPGDRWPNEFFVNRTRTQNAWIKLRLQGDTANYYGLGAMIRVRAENASGEAIVRFYHMDNKTGFGSAPYIAHIGLSDADTIKDVAVRWPGKRDFEYYPVRLRTLNLLRQNQPPIKGVNQKIIPCFSVLMTDSQAIHRGQYQANAMKPELVIHWFRQDLRTSDNPALHAAARRGIVFPVYILDDANAGDYRMGAASRWWLHHSLHSLYRSLDDKLRVFTGSPERILPALALEQGATAVYWNRCYEPWRIQRDQRLMALLREQGIAVHSFNGSLLWEPWTVVKQDGTPYKVFSPFYRKGCLSAGQPRKPLPAPETLRLIGDSADQSRINDLGLLPAIRWDESLEAHWQIGEAGATNRFDAFLDNRLANYKQDRDFPAKPAVSRLSPHLHFGELSPNQAWYAARAVSDSQNLEHFCSELAWREFSYNLLYHNPELPRRNLQAKFDSFPWRDNRTMLRRWQHGLTGYPMVDAGMRELWQTGYMHNRVRMITASFLVKNLLLNWRYGERWFWDCLVDADLANNSASWQWVAGCGADAAPYFRIFNPVTQGRKFDPSGEYIRRFIPELRGLPDKYLFSPWEAPAAVLENAGIKLGKTYPRPITDLKLSRREALAAFQTLKKNRTNGLPS